VTLPGSARHSSIIRLGLTCAVTVVLGTGSSARPSESDKPAPPANAPRLSVPFTQFTLPNGLRVIVHEDHSVPVIAVNVWYHVGSGREKPGRTGFAHLFEHLMFEGSRHVKEGDFDNLLEAVGANNNGSTNSDRTNYFIDGPSNSLELSLFLESDRMGYLLDSMSPQRVDGQRDVVKNERRQGVENAPYGMAPIVLDELLFPKDHPYHWPTIGYMDDLTAASFEDVVEFFKKYYGPNNASLVIAGDVDTATVKAAVERWFADVKRGPDVGPIVPPVAALTSVTQKTITDRVQLPRLYLAWLTPGSFRPGDAELDVVASVLAGGKNSRLYKRLVYDMQVAQNVSAFQASADLLSTFQIIVTARPGQKLEDLKKVVDEELEKLRTTPPSDREVERAVNGIEAGFYARMERVGGFGGKADQLNAYLVRTGEPDYFAKDLARYLVLTPSDVRAAAATYLPADRRVELSVVAQQ
jgi:zinc protease